MAELGRLLIYEASRDWLVSKVHWVWFPVLFLGFISFSKFL
jgi:hypothetical protein